MGLYKEREAIVQAETEAVREQLAMAQDTLARFEHSERDESVFDEKEEHLLRLEG